VLAVLLSTRVVAYFLKRLKQRVYRRIPATMAAGETETRSGS